MAQREGPTAIGSAEGRGPAVCASAFLVAGEASGDWAGAMLAQALRRRRADLKLRGIGGSRMSAAGVDLFANSSGWGAIGVFEAAARVPRVWRTLRATRSLLASSPPDVLVLIDCGAFNVPLARFARQVRIPTLYYFPPGSWSRKLRGPDLRDLVEVIATPFPWSRDLLTGGRARVEWVGHPLVEAARPELSRTEAWKRYALDPSRPVVALAPGSREQELHYVLPALADAAGRLAREFRGLQLLVPVAATLERQEVKARLADGGLTPILLSEMDYNALQLAQAAAVCSGMATLEFACLGVPMVVVYRASRATTLQYRLVRGLIGRQRFAAMPNIIAGREIVPELLGSAAQPAAIAAGMAALLTDSQRQERMKRDMSEVVAALGQEGASDRTAQLVLELVGQRR